MRDCLKCGHELEDSSSWTCPSCGWAPNEVDGVVELSESLAERFREELPEEYDRAHEVANNHFWFHARTRMVLWALERWYPNASDFMQIGCGAGNLLAEIRERFPTMRLTGTEIHVAPLQHARRRVQQATFLQMDSCRMPFREHFDVIGAFDVLEHVEEDEQTLRQAFAAIRPGGGLLLTVPQHKALWTEADEHACHMRRYSKRELTEKVKQAGFAVDFVNSYTTFLLPGQLGMQSLNRLIGRESKALRDVSVNPPLNLGLRTLLRVERRLLRLGLPMPAGDSLILVAHKPH